MILLVAPLAALVAWELLKGKPMTPKILGPKTPTRADQRSYVDRLRPIALRVEREGGIAPDGTKVLPGIKADLGVLESAHESSWGLSQLAGAPAYNIFGMTAELGTYWRTQLRPYFEIITTEWDKAGKEYKTVRPFRAYASWEASYLDWARRIQKPDFAPVYAAAIRGDWPAFGAALDQVKYATDPKYGAKIVSMAQAAKAAGLV